MIQIGIIGGAGYTAGELIRLLLHHPEAGIAFVHSNSHAGSRVADVHAGCCGETALAFTPQVPTDAIDVLFCCSAHGDTKKFLDAHPLPEHVKVIDLSMDYRMAAPEHDFVYGLPELNRQAIRRARHVANPGCFATCIQLALLPLAGQALLKDDVHVHAITGSTGAGVKPTETSHFSWRNDNVSIYKPFTHQHLNEIRQSLTQLQRDFRSALRFIPVRGCFSRGIFVTAYTKCTLPEDEVQAIYEAFYADHPFTFVTPHSPDLKQVVNTNKCLLHLQKSGDLLLITSVIDNLLKGASGQAVHNMNLMSGLEEQTGLRLKPSAF
ncbi:MAG: N-acetyl-gamma-glutamyl-phosphate reductase [Tannerella sp.]|jgi:N-acetyl-gamma-glutamyl-phosphate reductase|nr:N-acetyl-gamma-glutamyl-phosphate reductase [Tannerella sp.]